jgi:aminopeptidase N
VNESISQLEINLLDNMVVDSVLTKNFQANFNHTNDMILITLDRSYNPGEKAGVRIYYRGNPTQTGFGSFGFDRIADQPMIWSLSEPFGARNWWPCKDIPADKADSVDIRITVPEPLVVVSNGILRSVVSENNKKTYWWHEKYPITTYLVSVAIHPYAKFSDSLEVVPGKIMHIDYYVFPSEIDNARQAYSKTKDMITIFSDLFGPYPFFEEKYGHAQFVGGANMEHQTISSLRTYNEYTIAHELAHQWWGNLITCRDFGHIWLNEGFATYSEALWAEFYYGKQAYWENINRNQYFGGGTIFVTQMNVSTIFNFDRSYRKGSWILHMLRHVVGDG